MHTVIVVGMGVVLLGVCVLLGRFLGGPAGVPKACLIFLPLWFAGAAINMYLGVVRAGYSVAAESPIFFIVFGVPAALALLLRWKLG